MRVSELGAESAPFLLMECHFYTEERTVVILIWVFSVLFSSEKNKPVTCRKITRRICE